MVKKQPMSVHGVLATAAIAMLAGCALVAGVDFDAVHPRESTSGSGAGGGATCSAGCSDCIVYVSPTGSDANDGCSPATAKQSFQGALSKIVTEELAGHAIHACKGSYAESLTLTQPVSISGGYDCATFSDGAPELNETIVAGDGSNVTLRISGASADASVVIDRLTVVGPTGIPDTAVGVIVRDGATPVIRNSSLRGGEGTGTLYGSAGVWIDENAGPNLEDNDIHGGAGTSEGFGSVGLLVNGASSSLRLTGNTIVGGTGTGGVNGVGACAARFSNVTLIGDDAVTGNAFRSGKGSGPANTWLGIGVLLADDAAVELVDNWIFGEDAACVAGPCFQAALGVQSSAPTLVSRNRIYGGRAQGDVTQSGIWLELAANARIENNFIHGGGVTDTTRAVDIRASASSVTLSYNTVFTGGGMTSTGIVIDPGSSSIRIDGNLIGGNGAAPLAITANCNQLASLRNNAFADFPADLAVCPTPMPDVPDLEMAVGANASDNKQLESVCMGESWCVEFASCGSACFPSLFAAFTAPFGEPELGAEGWRLSPSAPCEIVNGGGADGPENDHYGTARGTPLSIGAEETSNCL